MLRQKLKLLLLVGWCHTTLLAQTSKLDHPIRLDKTEWRVDQLLKELEDQAEVSFAYGDLSMDRMVTLSEKNMTLSEVLNRAFEGQSVTFKASDDKVLIYPRKPEQSEKTTVNGYITDAATGEALIGVTVYDTLYHQGATTNVYGYYSYSRNTHLDLPLVFSYVGYRDTLVWYRPVSEGQMSIALSPTDQQLEEVVIETSRLQDTQMSVNSFSPKDIQRLPSLMGEPDLLKTITLTPGIKFGADNASGFYVRGGGPDQNLILLDGATIYNPTHAFDLFSTFNTSAVKHIDVIKGGFPARYSGRLSSVLDVRMKEGNTQKVTGEVGLGYLLSKFTVEGPLGGENTSFLVSGRRTFMDLIFKFVGDFEPAENRELQQDIIFGDLSAKVNHRFSDKDQVFLSYYGSGDRLDVTEKERNLDDAFPFESEMDVKLGWSNRIVAARWNHLFSDKLFANTTATYTKFDINVDLDSRETYGSPPGSSTNIYINSFNSEIEDYGVKLQFDYFPSANHNIKFGLNGIQHQFRPGVSGIQIETEDFEGNVDLVFDDQETSSVEASAFVEDEVSITDKLKTNIGVHAALLNVEGKTYHSIQPRIAMNYQLNNQVSLSASYAEMAQFIHLLTNSTLGIPLDLWVPATPDAPPMQSRQMAAGVSYRPSREYLFTFETYYKTMDNLIAYKEGATFTNAQESWQSKIETGGEGEAYGFEFFLQKKTGRTTGWLGYTLSWTDRQFENLNAGRVFPYKYDRRHDISLVAMHEISDRINLSASWVFASGNAVSFPYGRTTALPDIPALTPQYDPGTPTATSIDVFEGRNTVRMPNYHRLDIGINFVKQKKRGTRTWNLSVYNTYLNQNPFIIYTNDPESATGNGDRELIQVSSYWIVPSITYNFKFN
ncbi:MAG: TonB-dependent receptor [Cyclobacteriaceae bacterium]